MKYNLDILKKGISELNIELSDKQYEDFISYYELLIEWNSFMNLTAITEWDEVCTKHFIDSLSLVKVMKDMTTTSYSLIDIGTGAGFPGIPLKIAFPKLNVVLLDSLNKRINFLNEVIDSLNLENIKAFHGRAEEFAHNKEHREKYDIVVSRAVANMTSLSEYCIPFIKIGGSFISYKSEKISEEYNNAKHAIALLGGEFNSQVDFILPGSDIYRNLFVINKVKSTHNKYPRKAGLPTKEPLL